MDSNVKNTDVKRYTLIPQTTPLASSSEKKHSGTSPKKSSNDAAPTQPVRAINEDDDGYDPYSDYKEKPQLFEKDPWY